MLSKSKSTNNFLTKHNSHPKLRKSTSEKNVSIEDKINKFKEVKEVKKPAYDSNEVKELVERGYQILKNMDNLDEVKQGYHIKLKLKSTAKKNNNKIIQGGFLLKVVREVVDGKLEFYIQLKSYNKVYRYNVDNIAYIFYKEVTPNAKKIENLEKKIELMEKKHKLEYLKLLKLIKTTNSVPNEIKDKSINKKNNKKK